MNISELITLLEQTKSKYGDMLVGAYSAEYCYELGKADDMMGITLRVMTSYSNASATSLPGIDPAKDEQEGISSRFLTIFYLDD